MTKQEMIMNIVALGTPKITNRIKKLNDENAFFDSKLWETVRDKFYCLDMGIINENEKAINEKTIIENFGVLISKYNILKNKIVILAFIDKKNKKDNECVIMTKEELNAYILIINERYKNYYYKKWKNEKIKQAKKDKDNLDK